MTDEVEFIRLSRDEVDAHYCDIINKMDDYMPDVIIGLSRGGLDMGVRLSHYFASPFVPLVWQTRDDVGKDFTTLVSVLNKYKEQDILIVDDICDTGKTLEEIMEFVPSTSKVSIAVLVKNTYCDFECTWHAKEVSNEKTNFWVVFPWETI